MNEEPEPPLELLDNSKLTHIEQAAIGHWAHRISYRMTELESEVTALKNMVAQLRKNIYGYQENSEKK